MKREHAIACVLVQLFRLTLSMQLETKFDFHKRVESCVHCTVDAADFLQLHFIVCLQIFFVNCVFVFLIIAILNILAASFCSLFTRFLLF